MGKANEKIIEFVNMMTKAQFDNILNISYVDYNGNF